MTTPKGAIDDRVDTCKQVWTPADSADLGLRDAVAKILLRLAAAGRLRRVERGLCDRPELN